MGCCHLREFSNCTRLDKNKTGGEPSEQEMKCDNEAISSHMQISVSQEPV